MNPISWLIAIEFANPKPLGGGGYISLPHFSNIKEDKLASVTVAKPRTPM